MINEEIHTKLDQDTRLKKSHEWWNRWKQAHDELMKLVEKRGSYTFDERVAIMKKHNVDKRDF